MNFPPIGSLVQLRSGGPVFTATVNRRSSGRVTCMWFSPGVAQCVRHTFDIRCLVVEVYTGEICEHGGLWGRWRAKQLGGEPSQEASHSWALPQPSWMWDGTYYGHYDHVGSGHTPYDEHQAYDDEDDDEDEDENQDVDQDLDHEDFVDEMDIDSESHARSHEDGWFYSDEDPGGSAHADGGDDDD